MSFEARLDNLGDEPGSDVCGCNRAYEGGISDMCCACKDNLVVEGEEMCRDCLGEVFAEMDALEQPYPLSSPKHPDFHSVYADVWDAREGK